MPRRRTPRPDWVLTRRIELGHRIATLRRERGLSQDDLAAGAGLERRSIQRYEHGQRDPQASDLFLIANALNCHVTELFR
ncbi:helix-turn-helix domain-containing protein [Streptomyces sp. NBC_00306]|uniref:helix-turn-helix domain-containing protein n=1 Tax=Streptomyces sp. NBC_00306 TaxID=2975708 RepID=UPI002E2A6088|nr:helix-turn-helix transcriptional regulator [Streptomyces sp. NBC_00306]